jgi:hypothetical protein
MPKALVWTRDQDQVIINMRRNRDSWAAIGFALGISRNTAIDRGRRLGAQLGDEPPKDVLETPEERSKRILKEMMPFPIEPPDCGPPHRVCQAGVGSVHISCDKPVLRPGVSYCAEHHAKYFYTPMQV